MRFVARAQDVPAVRCQGTVRTCGSLLGPRACMRVVARAQAVPEVRC